MGLWSCLRYRGRLQAHADGWLTGRVGASVRAHLSRCSRCRPQVEQLELMRRAVRAARPAVVDPDWAGFWPGVRARLATEPARPIRDPWWLPVWKPVWGHPRLAVGVAAAAVAAGIAVWPLGGTDVPPAMVGHVIVQDVGTHNPQDTVMVYADRNDDVTVIWLFAADAGQ